MQPAHILLSQAGLFKCHMAAKQFWVNARGLAKSATRHPTAFANCHKSPKHGPNIKKACLQMPQCPQIFFGKCKRAFSKCHLAENSFGTRKRGLFKSATSAFSTVRQDQTAPNNPLESAKRPLQKCHEAPPPWRRASKHYFPSAKRPVAKVPQGPTGTKFEGKKHFSK